MKHQYIGGILCFYFYGSLNNLTVCDLKQICIGLIERYQPKTVKFDFEEVTFVDNTDIGFVLARYRRLQKLRAQLILCNLSRVNQTLFEVSGIFQIMGHERSEVKL